jgi:anti-anti-sigma regulatory factor
MVISSRTPEGQPNHCPVCGNFDSIEPSDPAGDAPCPRCGHLLWFTWQDFGDVQVIKLTGDRLQRQSFDRLSDSIAVRPASQLVLDFSEVHRLSTALLGELIHFKKRVAGYRGRVRLRGLHPFVRETLRVCRFDRLFDVEV